MSLNPPALSPEQALETYDPVLGHGPWGAAQVAHLLSRAVGGAKPGDLVKLRNIGASRALDFIFEPDQEMLEAAWMGIGEPLSVTDDRAKMASWWLMKLVQDDRVTGSRLALFWHNHFATTWSKVQDGLLMYRQHLLFLEKGGGSFSSLLQEIAQDPAMLLFLDNESNRRGLPNENLARELLELFSLGVGHYNEKDVQEAARALTGRSVSKRKYNFVDLHHDPESKTVLGETVHDGDDLVRVALEQEACPRFLIRKFWAFYVSEQVDDAIVDLLAVRWRENYLDVEWLLRTMLGSRAFHQPESIACLVKSPVDFVVSTMRALGGRPDPQVLERACVAMGQELFEPPGVQGWKGGEAWIHTAAWLERTRFALNVSAGRRDLLRKSPLRTLFPPKRRLAIETALNDLLHALLPFGLAPARRRALLGTLRSLETASEDQRFQEMAYAVLCLPEFHMS